MDMDILGEAHGLKHFWAEHTTVPDLHPFP